MTTGGRIGFKRGSWLIGAGAAGLLTLAACERGQGPWNGATGGPGVATAASDPADVVTASAMRERAIEEIRRGATGDDALIRTNAVEAAGYAPTRLSDALRTGLVDPNPAVRTVALMTVGRQRIHELAPEAALASRDPNPFVKAAGLFAAARTGGSPDLTPLSNLLLGDPSPNVRAHVAFILGELGNRSALPLLRAAARAPLSTATPSQARLLDLQLCEAMVKLGDETQRHPIRAALYPSSPDELEAAVLAVQIIGQTQDRAAVNQLINVLNQRDRSGRPNPPEFRMAAASSLARLGQPRGVEEALPLTRDPNPLLRAQAAFTLGSAATPAGLRALQRLMDDPDPGVRVAAAAAILRGWGAR